MEPSPEQGSSSVLTVASSPTAPSSTLASADPQQPQVQPPRHKRPTIRRAKGANTTTTTNNRKNGNEKNTATRKDIAGDKDGGKETRPLIPFLKKQHKTPETTPVVVTSEATPTVTPTHHGIWKKQDTINLTTTASGVESDGEGRHVRWKTDEPRVVSDIDDDGDDDEQPHSAVWKPCVQDMVVERHPSSLLLKMPNPVPQKAAAAQAVEGYTPAARLYQASNPPKKTAARKDDLVEKKPPPPPPSILKPLGRHAAKTTNGQRSAPPTATQSLDASCVSSDAGTTPPTDLPLVSDLIWQARNEPPPTDSCHSHVLPPNQSMEAEMAFSCMAPEEYQQSLHEENAQPAGTPMPQEDEDANDEQADPEEDDDDDEDNNDEGNNDAAEEDAVDLSPVFWGKGCVFGDDDGSQDKDDEDDDDFAFFFSDKDDMDERPAPPPRTFRLFWEMLTAWMTVDTVEEVQSWQFESLQEPIWRRAFDVSDVGSSRCTGLQSLLHLHLSAGGWKELGVPPREQRQVQVRLVNLCRSFSYHLPNPRLEPELWKALTVVLLGIVLPQADTEPPPCAAAVRLTKTEYHYLTSRTFSTFSSLAET